MPGWWRASLACTLILACSTAAAAPFALATNQEANSLSVIDLATQQVTKEIPIPGGPVGVAIGHDARRIFVTTPTNHAIAVIDAATWQVVKTIAVTGEVLGIAADPVRDRIYAAAWYERKIWAIDSDTLKLVGDFPAGNIPAGLAVTRDGKLLVVANRDEIGRAHV